MFVLNADGQVLSAVLFFDNARVIPDYLDLTFGEFKKHPRATSNWQPVRYAKYPSFVAPTDTHGADSLLMACVSGACAAPRKAVAPKDLTIDMIGRSVGPDGKLSTDTLHQEHY